jgi:hypothetical protein
MAQLEDPQEDAVIPGSPAAIDRRKARKRELDRISQQRKRKNDRETISKLKTQVRALEQQTDDNHVYNLILKQEKDQDKIKRHIERVKQIEALIQADLKDLGEDDCGAPAAQLEASNPVVPRQQTEQHISNHSINTANKRESSTESRAAPAQQPRMVHLDGMAWNDLADDVHTISPPNSSKESPEAYMDLDDMSTFVESPPIAPLGIPELPLALEVEGDPHWALQDASSLNQSLQNPQCFKCESMWTVCDTAVIQGRGQFLYAGDTQSYVESDADIIITAITQGWSKASKSRWWSTQWESLRQIDQFCHSMCGPVERMASLWTLIHMFKYQRFLGDPLASQLPAFLHPRYKVTYQLQKS